jgi:hypothetical protein
VVWWRQSVLHAAVAYSFVIRKIDTKRQAATNQVSPLDLIVVLLQ